MSGWRSRQVAKRLLAKKNKYLGIRNAGYSLVEVLVGSTILAGVVATGAQLSNSSSQAINQMSTRSRIDSALAARMEDIRDQGFRHLCIQGCLNDELSLEPKYDQQELASLCPIEGLGQSLFDSLPADLTTASFNLREYDINPDKSTAPDITINQEFLPEGNRLTITLLAQSNPPQSITSIVVPHVQGWCP